MKDREQGYQFRWYLFRWLIGFLDVVEGVCCIVTLGLYTPRFSLKLCFYMMRFQKVWHKGKLYTRKQMDEILESGNA